MGIATITTIPTMFIILLSSLALVSAAVPFRDLLHAECSVKWTLSESCESAQEKIINQMILWDNEDCGTKPGDNSPHGQKCLYKHTGTNGLETTGTRTTSPSPSCQGTAAWWMRILYLKHYPCWT